MVYSSTEFDTARKRTRAESGRRIASKRKNKVLADNCPVGTAKSRL